MSWENIRGWFDYEDIYDQAIAEAGAGDTLVEVGVAYGRSLAYLARRAIDAGSHALILGVDPWPEIWGNWDDRPELLARYGGNARAAFEGEMAAHAVEERERVGVWQMTSLEAAEVMRATMGPFVSFVFIDGCHDEASVTADIAAWLPLVRPGGVIAGHDHTPAWPGVERAVRAAFGDAYEVRKSSWWKRV